MSTRKTALSIPGEILGNRMMIPNDGMIESAINHLFEQHEDTDGASIFVSYAHEDSQTVLPWVEELIDGGLVVNYDHGGLHTSGWFEELARSIDLSAGMIFVVSPRSIASRNCHMELRYALEAGKSIAFTQLAALCELMEV